MMTLARVVVDHKHAVQRDLLCNRFRWEDYGKPTAEKLTFRQFASYVLGAPTTSALGQAVSHGWTQTDELLANMTEQHAGLIKLKGRYPRPGVEGKIVVSDDTPEPEQTYRPPSAAQVHNAVLGGGQFDRFNSPDAFQQKLAEARAVGLKKADS